MSDCVFCNIVAEKIPCAKVWEDENFCAFLDIRPVTKGMTLVIPKKHFDSYIFNEDDTLISDLFKAGRKVAKMLEIAFDVSRVAVVSEGVGVNHLHLKLYPLHGFSEDSKFNTPKESLYFEKYEGYVSTQVGPEASASELATLAEYIRKKSNL